MNYLWDCAIDLRQDFLYWLTRIHPVWATLIGAILIPLSALLIFALVSAVGIVVLWVLSLFAPAWVCAMFGAIYFFTCTVISWAFTACLWEI